MGDDRRGEAARQEEQRPQIETDDRRQHRVGRGEAVAEPEQQGGGHQPDQGPERRAAPGRQAGLQPAAKEHLFADAGCDGQRQQLGSGERAEDGNELGVDELPQSSQRLPRATVDGDQAQKQGHGRGAAKTDPREQPSRVGHVVHHGGQRRAADEPAERHGHDSQAAFNEHGDQPESSRSRSGTIPRENSPFIDADFCDCYIAGLNSNAR